MWYTPALLVSIARSVPCQCCNLFLSYIPLSPSLNTMPAWNDNAFLVTFSCQPVSLILLLKRGAWSYRNGVTVVGGVGLSVCPLIDISPLECLFVLKIIPHTQQTMKVQKFVWISLKLLRCRDTSLPALYGYPCSRPFWKLHY